MAKKVRAYQFGKKGQKDHIKPKEQLRPIDVLPASVFYPELKPIQGHMPDSKEEYWVSLALDKLGYDYYYQYKVYGGTNLLGGQVIDFWVLTNPLPTPLYVQGKYWHGGDKAQASRYKIAQLTSDYAGQILTPVEIWDYEIPTPDVTLLVVKARLA